MVASGAITTTRPGAYVSALDPTQGRWGRRENNGGSPPFPPPSGGAQLDFSQSTNSQYAQVAQGGS